MADASRYRLDEMRRTASTLLAKVGMAPARASSLAASLLWFDAAGAAPFGIATLPDWLERLATNAVDPAAEGRVARETLGTAVFDGENGVAPLILARAGELATEKARDAGAGIVRVTAIKTYGPATAVAADMAVGPWAASILGPSASWSMAVPSDHGIPAVFDSALAAGNGDRAGATFADSLDPVVSWTAALLPEGDWLVAALGLTAIEPLSSVLERAGEVMRRSNGAPGRLDPAAWELQRRDVREHGVALTGEDSARLRIWADRLAVPLPLPLSPPIPSVSTPSGAS